MSILRHVMAGIRSLAKRDVVERDLDDELAHWAELAVKERMLGGIPRERAEREVRLEMGSIVAAREHVQAGGWEGAVESIARDVRYAIRTLRSAPAYAATAILTLAVAITIATTFLTVSNTVLRQHWAVPDAGRVFTIVVARGGPRISPAEARYLSERARTFSGIIAVRCLSGMNDDCQLSLDDGPAAVDFVSGNYFDVVGLPLAMGRGFVATEDRASDAAPVAVISDAMWRAHLGSDPRVVGSTLHLDGVRFTIIGVAAPGFTGTRTERKDLWVPLASMLLVRPQRAEFRVQLVSPSSDVSSALVAGRLAPGASQGQALAELTVLDRQYRRDNRLEELGVRFIPTTYFPNPSKIGTATAMLSTMFVAVALLLLLACANVGNLLLARATARGREIAVRLALGASRGRVIRQLLVESLLLSIAAGTIGVAASYAFPSMIMTRAFGSVSWRFVPDAVVMTAASALVLLTCIAFGLAPALHATRGDVAATLKTGDAGSRASSGRKLRSALLALQVAASLVLLVSAGILADGIRRGRDANVGYATHDVGVLTIDLPGVDDAARREGFVRQLMHDGRETSGFRVAFASAAPLGPSHGTRVHLPSDPDTRADGVDVFDVSPGFFDVIGLPIVEGRDFGPTDGSDAVLINQLLGRMLWPGESPLGHVLNDGTDRRVVGVVRDANMYRLGSIQGALFRPIDARAIPTIVTRPVNSATTQALGALASRIEPRATIRADSVAGNVDRQLGGLRVVTVLAGILGLVALVLASVGVFGVFAYVVHQRTREIGVRTALGASRTSVMALVLRDSARSVVSGLGIGVVLSIGVSRIISSELYGATALDWRVLGVIAGLLGVAGVAATFVPVRRATRVDPVVALRSD
jgi:predicted permease